MEDEPGKASMHANRPAFCSELPGRSFEQIDDIRPRSMERFNHRRGRHGPVRLRGKGLHWKDQAASRSLLADDLSRTRQHPSEQVPWSV